MRVKKHFSLTSNEHWDMDTSFSPHSFFSQELILETLGLRTVSNMIGHSQPTNPISFGITMNKTSVSGMQ